MRVILSLMVLCLSVAGAFARTGAAVNLGATSGTVVMTPNFIIETGPPKSVTCFDFATTCTAGGKVLATTPRITGKIIQVVTNPGATAPSDDYDITMTDSDGIDVLQGKGANRDTVNSESFCPLIGDGTTTVQPVFVDSNLTLMILAMGASKITTIRLTVER